MSSEHNAFSSLIEALKSAESSAKLIGVLRSDRRWDKIAEGIEAVRETVYKFEVVKQAKELPPE